MHAPRYQVARSLALAVALLVALSTASAQNSAGELTLAVAQELALAHAATVAEAAAELLASERDLDRAERDPLASGLERLQARHARDAALAARADAERTLRATTVQRYAAVVEAEAALRDARDAADVAARLHAAERVRADAGLITSLDLERSQADADRAEQTSRDAEIDLALRLAELALHVGVDIDTLRARGLTPIDDEPPPLEPLSAVVARAGLADPEATAHSGVASARRSVEIARVQLAGADHEAAAPNAVAAARDAVVAAERRLADALANADLHVRASHQAYAAAVARLADARQSDVTAATTLAAQRVRAEAGELAPITLVQAEMERARAADAAQAALHAAWHAWWRLEASIAGASASP